MKHRRTSVILATGGMGIVRAAYSSGKPAFGVGPGNVPAFIDRSADVKKAVADVVFGKTFDNGTICSSEQAIVVEEAIRKQVTEELKRNGAYFLTEDEMQRLGRDMVNLERHTINPSLVGKSAQRVAELGGIQSAGWDARAGGAAEGRRTRASAVGGEALAGAGALLRARLQRRMRHLPGDAALWRDGTHVRDPQPRRCRHPRVRAEDAGGPHRGEQPGAAWDRSALRPTFSRR